MTLLKVCDTVCIKIVSYIVFFRPPVKRLKGRNEECQESKSHLWHYVVAEGIQMAGVYDFYSKKTVKPFCLPPLGVSSYLETK